MYCVSWNTMGGWSVLRHRRLGMKLGGDDLESFSTIKYMYLTVPRPRLTTWTWRVITEPLRASGCWPMPFRYKDYPHHMDLKPDNVQAYTYQVRISIWQRRTWREVGEAGVNHCKFVIISWPIVFARLHKRVNNVTCNTVQVREKCFQLRVYYRVQFWVQCACI